MSFRLLGVFGALAILGITAAWWWRIQEIHTTVAASIPTRPALTDFPPEPTRRIDRCEQSLRNDPSDPSALGELAQLYQANGFLPEAARCYRGLLRLDPRNPRWAHRLAGIYAGFGELEAALSLWRQVLALRPDYLPAQLRAGDTLLKLNRAPEAAAAYAAVAQRDPLNPFALLGLARVDLAMQRWEAARERLEQAAAQSRGRIGADLLATVYEQIGDASRAVALRARTKSSGAFHDPPDPWLDEILDDCFDAYQLTVAAGFANHAGDTRTARRLIDRALTLAPANAPALYQSGTFALAQRDYDRARESFTACVRAAPEFADAWARLIHLYRLLGNSSAAESALAAGLRASPASPVLLVERASQLAAAGRTTEAMHAFEEALRAQPNDADALVKLAPVYFRLERIDDGIAALHRALAAEPDHPAALTALALHGIGSGNESAAREWLLRVRQQARVPRNILDEMIADYRKQFGRLPW